MATLMHVGCPHCHAILRGTDHSSRKVVECPGCHLSFVWPDHLEQGVEVTSIAPAKKSDAASEAERIAQEHIDARNLAFLAENQPHKTELVSEGTTLDRNLAFLKDTHPLLRSHSPPNEAPIEGNKIPSADEATFGNATTCFRCGKRIERGEARYRAFVLTGSSSGDYVSTRSMGMSHRDYRSLKTVCTRCKEIVSKEAAHDAAARGKGSLLLLGIQIATILFSKK